MRRGVFDLSPYLLHISYNRELILLEDTHTLLRHVQMQRELSPVHTLNSQRHEQGLKESKTEMQTFSRCSWYCGRLANISFMSFKFAAPSL